MATEGQITIRIPVGLMEKIDEEVNKGNYSSRAELIKTGIRLLLMQSAANDSNKPKIIHTFSSADLTEEEWIDFIAARKNQQSRSK